MILIENCKYCGSPIYEMYNKYTGEKETVYTCECKEIHQ